MKNHAHEGSTTAPAIIVDGGVRLISNPQCNGARQHLRPSSATAIISRRRRVGDGDLIQRNERRDGLKCGDHSLHGRYHERRLNRLLLRLHGLSQRRVLVTVRFIRMIILIVSRSGSLMIVTGDAVRSVAMIHRGDFHLAAAVTNIPAHHPKHLRPTQRKKREDGKQEGRAARHGILRRDCV
jgi:hypothetical protein